MAFNVLRQLATRSPIAMRERIALLAPSVLHSNAMMWRGNVSAQQYSQNNNKKSAPLSRAPSRHHIRYRFHETTCKKKEIDILLTQLASKLFF